MNSVHLAYLTKIYSLLIGRPYMHLTENLFFVSTNFHRWETEVSLTEINNCIWAISALKEVKRGKFLAFMWFFNTLYSFETIFVYLNYWIVLGFFFFESFSLPPMYVCLNAWELISWECINLKSFFYVNGKLTSNWLKFLKYYFFWTNLKILILIKWRLSRLLNYLKHRDLTNFTKPYAICTSHEQDPK